MTQPGYQAGSEPMWWWKVALHLDEALLALANAMAHNLDDQRPVFAIQDRLREGQAILLEIFRMKGLLPGAPNGTAAVPMPPMPGVPMPMSGMPMQPFVPAPMIDGDVAVAPAPALAEQAPPLVAEEPVVAAASTATITSPVPTTAAPSADSVAGGPAGR